MQSSATTVIPVTKKEAISEKLKGFAYITSGVISIFITGVSVAALISFFIIQNNVISSLYYDYMLIFFFSGFVISLILTFMGFQIVAVKKFTIKEQMLLYSFMGAIAVNAISGLILLPDLLTNIGNYLKIPYWELFAYVEILMFLAILFHGEIQEEIKRIFK
jgi:hypothetical protein